MVLNSVILIPIYSVGDTSLTLSNYLHTLTIANVLNREKHLYAPLAMSCLNLILFFIFLSKLKNKIDYIIVTSDADDYEEEES